MIQLRPVLFAIGLFLIALGLLMLLPTLYMFLYDEPGLGSFLASSGLTIAVGLALYLQNRHLEFSINTRQAFVLTTLTWMTVSAFSALPLLLVEHISYTDAFFETMSGITTTGATVLEHLDHHPRGILLWRSLLQWLGGIGFIVMGVAILPFLRVGGMRLFHSESSDWSEKVLPRFSSFAHSITFVYLILTLANALAYYVAGMGLFDALNHAMTTISTGGYSTYDDSMGHFTSPSIHWIGVGFMILGGLPFSLYVRALNGDIRSLATDSQVRAFLQFVITVSVLLAAWLWFTHGGNVLELLTTATFNVVSIVTTTGFVSSDYNQWGTFSVMVFFYLMFVGACSGSTSGAIKIFRFQVAQTLLKNQLYRLVHPRAILSSRYNNREITDDITRSIVAFSFFFAITIMVLAAALAMLGLDFLTSLTSAVTAVTNVGPGLGDVVGPAENFATLPDAAKWLLSIGMLLGRLEIMTVLVLFTPSFWRG